MKQPICTKTVVKNGGFTVFSKKIKIFLKNGEQNRLKISLYYREY